MREAGVFSRDLRVTGDHKDCDGGSNVMAAAMRRGPAASCVLGGIVPGKTHRCSSPWQGTTGWTRRIGTRASSRDLRAKHGRRSSQDKEQKQPGREEELNKKRTLTKRCAAQAAKRRQELPCICGAPESNGNLLQSTTSNEVRRARKNTLHGRRLNR